MPLRSPEPSQPEAPRYRRLLADLREALGGSSQDFTTGSLNRAILLLAVPMVLEMVMESLLAVVDVFFVARLGSQAVAVVGLTEALVVLIYTLAGGFGIAVTAMVSRRIGEKDPEAAAFTAVQTIAGAVLIGLVLGTIGLFSAGSLLRLMGASPEMVAQGTGYISVMLGTNTVILLLFVHNAVFRGAGDATMAMRTLWLANGINIVLDPCLIFGLGPFPELGLTGAAVATVIGRSCGVLFQLWSLTRGRARVTIARRHLRVDPALLLRLVKLSAGGVAQNLIATASWIFLVRIVATFGDSAVAGYTIAIRVIIFALLPAWGLANAAATLVGQSLGAGDPQRAERAVWLTGIYNSLFLGTVAAVMVVAARPLVGIFTHDPAVIPTAVSCLRLISYGYVFYGWGMVLLQALNGAGDTRTPTLINFVCFWLVQIPLAYVLSHSGLSAIGGVNGAFFAIAASYSLHAVLSLMLFRRGRWKHQRV